jgi:hypothetical protein
MIYNPSVQYGVDCDDVGIAMSQQVSCLGRMKNDVLVLLLRKQSMVLFAFFLFLLRIEQRFLQTLSLSLSYIAWLLICLFRFVYSVFSVLGIASLFCERLYHFLFSDSFLSIRNNKIYTCLSSHLSCLCERGTQTMALFSRTTYKFSFAPLELMRDGV